VHRRGQAAQAQGQPPQAAQASRQDQQQPAAPSTQGHARARAARCRPQTAALGARIVVGIQTMSFMLHAPSMVV
jgi:hypothetical protein